MKLKILREEKEGWVLAQEASKDKYILVCTVPREYHNQEEVLQIIKNSIEAWEKSTGLKLEIKRP